MVSIETIPFLTNEVHLSKRKADVVSATQKVSYVWHNDEVVGSSNLVSSLEEHSPNHASVPNANAILMAPETPTYHLTPLAQQCTAGNVPYRHSCLNNELTLSYALTQHASNRTT